MLLLVLVVLAQQIQQQDRMEQFLSSLQSHQVVEVEVVD